MGGLNLSVGLPVRTLYDESLAPLWPAVPVLAAVAVWAWANGGYEPTSWYPGAMLVLACLGAAFLLRRRALPTPLTAMALVAFAGYVAWSYLSTTWAESPGIALEGSNRALLYLAAFALFALLPWRPRSAMMALGLLTLGMGLVAVATLLRLLLTHDVQSLFSSTSLATPIRYQNANACLWGITAPLALLGAARVGLPAPLRGLFLGLAGLEVQLGLLTQSRGWLVTFCLLVAIAVAISDDRWRLLLAVVVVGCAALVVAPSLFAVYAVSDITVLPGAVHRAAVLSMFVVSALVAVGWIVAALDRRGTLPRRPSRIALVALAVLAGLGAVTIGVGLAADRATHFSDSNTGRSDLWRVSLELAAEHPVTGLGQDNFAAKYSAERRTNQDWRWPHSLPLRQVVHTGFVGLGLFSVFVVTALGAAATGRTDDDTTRAVALAATLPTALWLLHGSVDWLWEFPALTVTAMATLGMATALRSSGRYLDRQWRRSPWCGVAVLAIVLGIVGLIPPYLGARDLASGVDSWEKNADQAYALLDRSRRENPLMSRPDIAAGLIAVNLGDLPLARARFLAAIRREPSDWFPHFALGLVETAAEEPDAARSALRVAQRLNPREQVITVALGQLDTAKPFTFESGREELRPVLQEMTHVGGTLDYAARAALPLVGR